jgi:5-methylcytosine-specific restriction enzyme subunit McrC
MTGESPRPTTRLVEHRDSRPLSLGAAERETLRTLVPGLSVTEVGGEPGRYVLNPGNAVGAVQIGDHRFALRPKIAIRRLLFLVSYSMDPRQWRRLEFDFAEDDDIFEAMIPGFAFQLEEALRGGPLHGYRLEEEPLHTVRGRIRIADQLRTRFGLIPPIECAYDEFTEDIAINRLLKAAITQLGQIRIRRAESRTRLRALAKAFSNVSPVQFDPRHLPEIRYNRLNERFRRPVEVARLILRSRSFDARPGDAGGASFVIDLAKVFEDFVATALREALGLPPRLFPRQASGRHLYLDADRTIGLKPDLTWWRDERCVFVGDVKYKKTASTAGVQHPDIYQLLAYTTATELPRGLLVYAAGEDVERVVRIPGANKQVEVVTLDLNREPAEVLARVGRIAEVVRAQMSSDESSPKSSPTATLSP